MSETTPGVTPQEAPKKASPVRILLMLVFGGPVLAVGGCALFLANLRLEGSGGSDPLSALGALIFAAGCLALLVGIIWALARWVDKRFAKSKAQDSKAPDQTNTPNVPQ